MSPPQVTRTGCFIIRIEPGERVHEPADGEVPPTAVGISRPVALRRLWALEQAGLVRWSGKSQTDPRAVWALT